MKKSWTYLIMVLFCGCAFISEPEDKSKCETKIFDNINAANSYAEINNKYVITYYAYSPDSANSLFAIPSIYNAAKCDYAILFRDLNDENIRHELSEPGWEIEEVYWVNGSGGPGIRSFYPNEPIEDIIYTIGMGIGP